jgi:hypothetical protein
MKCLPTLHQRGNVLFVSDLHQISSSARTEGMGYPSTDRIFLPLHVSRTDLPIRLLRSFDRPTPWRARRFQRDPQTYDLGRGCRRCIFGPFVSFANFRYPLATSTLLHLSILPHLHEGFPDILAGDDVGALEDVLGLVACNRGRICFGNAFRNCAKTSGVTKPLRGFDSAGMGKCGMSASRSLPSLRAKFSIDRSKTRLRRIVASAASSSRRVSI